jgi:hypothetical protein
MKKRVTLQMEGGLGKQIALTSLIPYFKERYEEVIVLSSYPDIFENNPDVYRNISYATPFAYEEYLKNSDDIFYACGYRESDFRKQRIHLIEAACRSIGIEYNPKMKPRIFFTEKEEAIIAAVKKQFGTFIILQAHGGHTQPIDPNINSNLIARDLKFETAEEFVKLFKEKYPQTPVINFALPKEAEISGVVQMDFNARIWSGLVRECATFLAIDSSLQHMSAFFEKKGVVMWGATNPLTFGWPHNMNLENNKCGLNDYHCQRPYFVPSVDIRVNGVPWECPNKICMKFDSKELLEKVESLMPEEIVSPTVDLSKYIVNNKKE